MKKEYMEILEYLFKNTTIDGKQAASFLTLKKNICNDEYKLINTLQYLYHKKYCLAKSIINGNSLFYTTTSYYILPSGIDLLHNSSRMIRDNIIKYAHMIITTGISITALIISILRS